jgi:multimeric flavodoxin WrbA
MKVLVLTGSPHKQGTSALLADEFIRGAKESGNEVFRFDAAFEDVHTCVGCLKCEYGKNPCVFNDAMTELNPHLPDSGIIVFITPVYYHGFSAQLKSVIDRFQATVFSMQGNKKVMLMATAAHDEAWVMDGLTAHYRNLNRYMRWKDIGMVLAIGCATKTDIEKTNFPKQAYELGKSILN